MLHPIRIERTETGYFVLDKGAFRAVELNDELDEVRSFGNGQGEGPGEFVNPISLAVTDQGIWIADSRSQKLSLFGHDGELLGEIIRERPFAALTATESSLILHNGPHEHSFTRIELPFSSDRTPQETSFGLVTANQTSRNYLARFGEIRALSDSTFLFYGLNGGRFGEFETSGETVYFRSTIDDNPFPQLLMSELGISVDRATARPVAAGLIGRDAGNLFFIRAAAAPEPDLARYLDVYSRVDGAYLESLEYDLDCAPVLYADSVELVAVCEGQLTRFTEVL